MIVFVVLYLVVHHLVYWTKMEDYIARVRRGNSQGSDALYSVACFLGSLLIEDLAEDVRDAASSGAAGAGGMQGPGGGRGGGARGAAGMDPLTAAGAEENFVPLSVAGAVGGSSITNWVDYARETVFQEVRQSIGDVEVKGKIVDNESRIPLNQIFDLARRIRARTAEELNGGALAGIGEGDLVGAVTGASSDAAAAANLERLARGAASGRGGAATSARGAATSRTTAAGRGAGSSLRGAPTARGEASSEVDEAVSLALGRRTEEEILAFQEPTETEIADATEILKRAIWVMISMNVDRGYVYEGNYTSEAMAEQVAMGIVEYVLARRRSNVQNFIYHPSEILNVPLVTSELYYGPRVEIPPGEEMLVYSPGPYGELYEFYLKRDEFGELVATPAPYLLPDQELARQIEEERRAQIEALTSEFAGLGLQSLLSGTSYTQGMEDPPVIYEEDGINGAVLEAPLPLGLKDLVCTFSSGRININTAPVPVLYAVLLSLEPGLSEANDVALLIHDYRNRLQEVTNPESTRLETDTPAPDLGQPRRELPPTDEELANLDPTDPLYLESLGATYQDLETNYFTNLEQIELVDGWDGGPQDILRKEIEMVSDEKAGLLQRVIGDLTNVAVFGSTYFTFELSARLPGSPLVKRSWATVKRDTNQKILEYLLWKEVE